MIRHPELLKVSHASARAMHIVNAHGSALVGSHNDLHARTVQKEVADALVASGVLERFAGPKGEMVRRTKD